LKGKLLISDQQVKKLWRFFDNGESISSASLKAGLHEKTGSKYLKLRTLPSKCNNQRSWRTRQDPFIGNWDEIKEKIKKDPKIPATVIFKDLQRQKPGFYNDGQLRTLQRKVKAWKRQKNIVPNYIPIKTDNLDFIIFMKYKKKLFHCMRNGKSYIDLLQQMVFPNINLTFRA
jgi:hypothetical protein